MKFDLRAVQISDIEHLFERFHGYGGCGKLKTYAFAVFEKDLPIAAYIWLQPPIGAARSVCPEAPEGVLALSRMVAVPKDERRLKHISKPLKAQFNIIDRGRYPVLITYSDEGQGHTGYVYKCSGMEMTLRSKVPYFVDSTGKRVSAYSNGKMRTSELTRGGTTFIQRWEHWICAKGEAAAHMAREGWVKEPIPGRVWRSGNQAHRIVKHAG